jgi:hypothetical protein
MILAPCRGDMNWAAAATRGLRKAQLPGKLTLFCSKYYFARALPPLQKQPLAFLGQFVTGGKPPFS